MLTKEEAQAVLVLIDRASISVKEAETAVALKQKLMQIAKGEEPKKK